MSSLTEQELLDLFFHTCDTKDELQVWLKTFLKVDFPDDTVDELSTSNPMQLVWEIYSTMKTNVGPKMHVTAAARDSSKTLTAATVAFLAMIHYRRDVVYVSALKQQSRKALKYFRKHCRIKYLKPYVTSLSTFEVAFQNLPANDFTVKNDAQVVVCAATLEAVNGERGNCIAYDQEILTKQYGYVQAASLWKKIRNGEQIDLFSVNEKTKVPEWKKCLGTKRNVNLDRITIEADDEYFTCTPDHPVASIHYGVIEYKLAKDLSVDDTIVYNNENTIIPIIISKIDTFQASPTSRARWVYDFQVEDNHNFFVRRFLVHNCIIYDETDLVAREIISEGALMASATTDEHGFNPISLYLSSRKSNSGPLQDLIDDAEGGSTHIRLHKYSMVDWMRRCTPDVHLEAGQKVFLDDKHLKIFWDKLPEEQSNNIFIKELNVYKGCKTCPAFVACQGRAPKQKSQSRFLKSISFVGDRLQTTRDPQKIIAQILNWKPESSGLVFSMFDVGIHVKDTKQIWEWVTKEKWSNVSSPTKTDIYLEAMRREWMCTFGIDWGYKDPAVNVVLLYYKKEQRGLLLHSRRETGLANSQWAKSVIDKEFVKFPPNIIAPDMADAASPVYFKACSGVMVKDTKPSRIETGVSQIRSLLWSVEKQEPDFLICRESENDDGINEAIKCFQKWSHKKNAAGKYDVNAFEDDEFTHEIDSCRYGLDFFIKSRQVNILAGSEPEAPKNAANSETVANHIQDIIAEQYRQWGIDPSVFDPSKQSDLLQRTGLMATDTSKTKEDPKPRNRISFDFS